MLSSNLHNRDLGGGTAHDLQATRRCALRFCAPLLVSDGVKFLELHPIGKERSTDGQRRRDRRRVQERARSCSGTRRRDGTPWIYSSLQFNITLLGSNREVS